MQPTTTRRDFLQTAMAGLALGSGMVAAQEPSPEGVPKRPLGTTGEKLTITNRADGEQFLFVWQGRLTLRTTEGTLEVGERETAFIGGSEALEAVNPAPGEAIVIQVRTPASEAETGSFGTSEE